MKIENWKLKNENWKLKIENWKLKNHRMKNPKIMAGILISILNATSTVLPCAVVFLHLSVKKNENQKLKIEDWKTKE